MRQILTIAVLGGCLVLSVLGLASGESARTLPDESSPLMTGLHLYLTAGDYRRALELSQREIDDAPSAASYIHLTYLYHAIDACLEFLSRAERWMAVEQLYWKPRLSPHRQSGPILRGAWRAWPKK